MDKDSKKVLDDKYGVPEDVETFAAKIADKQDNPSIHELAKASPEKTYTELEKYRKADRVEEAIGIGHNNPPDEGEEQENPTLWEIAKANDVSYADAVPIQEDMRLKRDALKAACTIGEMRKDRTPMANMKKRAEEAEGELSIMKGIETNRVKEAQAALANALEVNESHQRLNGKLQVRIAELEDENKQMHDTLEKKLEDARKAGL